MIGVTSLRIVSWLVSPMMRPFPRLNAAVWNAQYRFGVWDYLDNPGDGAQILNLVEEYHRTPKSWIWAAEPALTFH